LHQLPLLDRNCHDPSFYNTANQPRAVATVPISGEPHKNLSAI
jgi:hypothetical protein